MKYNTFKYMKPSRPRKKIKSDQTLFFNEPKSLVTLNEIWLNQEKFGWENWNICSIQPNYYQTKHLWLKEKNSLFESTKILGRSNKIISLI